MIFTGALHICIYVCVGLGIGIPREKYISAVYWNFQMRGNVS
jgi:hypothetical protein